ncbi:hypothetical protein HanIR_Chr11g0539501 [Helianthus annuus]|nr:hypothetical protein HanIR_Chr11g0539501 [Helianthus annuus]
MKLELELGSVQAYFFELELGSRVKPKARAWLGSARLGSNYFENNLKRAKAQLELNSTSLKQAKARLELGSSMLSSLLIYYI